jgi:hypothetical protein
LRGAVVANIGVMLLPRSRVPDILQTWDDGPLPPAPSVYGGVFLREGVVNEMLEHLADLFADTLRPASARPLRFASPDLAGAEDGLRSA